MADSPTILGPDGTYRTTLRFTTTRDRRVFEGTVDPTAIDMQVSVNGSGFSSDPSLIFFGDGKWVVPNPTYEPDGLYLLQGVNTIEIRSTAPTGSVSPSAEAVVTLAANDGVVAATPTNVSLVQGDTAVTVRAEPLTTTGFRGMNFYASRFAGGGAEGYARINVNLVSSGVVTQETDDFGSVEYDSDVIVDAVGQPLADPMFLRLRTDQEDEDESVLQSDLNTTFEIPETARKLRVSSTVFAVRDTVLYEFPHDRSASPTSTPPTVSIGVFASTPSSSVLHYVVTAVYYDETTNTEYESAYSEEVVGRPLKVSGVLGTFPVATRQQIVAQFIGSIFRTNPQIRVEAGSVLRDTVIDPFSSESERLRFILDFFHRARTPTLLLQIDDPNGSGSSVPVAQSPYKRGLRSAFYLESDAATQNVIDAAFEAYAGNFGILRRAGIASRGEVTFYTNTRPSNTILFPIGTTVAGGATEFSTTRDVRIDVNQLASYYDPVRGRYSVTAPVRAVVAGSTGNLGVGQITAMVSNIPGANVTNTGATFGGLDGESNLALTVRTRNALASVDSGTKQGYLQTAADVPGVVKASVVAAGDPLMQRDLASDGVHRGGKVDVWVQGTSEATVTDTFAFAFDIAQDIQFELVGDPADLRFQAIDPLLTEDRPIVEMLDYPDAGYEFRNVSTGEVFDLSGVTIESFNTIVLSTDVPQPSVSFADVVLGSYRRRTGNTFVLPRQPVASVSSVSGSVSGTLPTSAYDLVYVDAPLDLGRSSLSNTYIDITGYTDADGNVVPSGDLITVTDESHTLLGTYPEFLDSLGANYLTIRVYNQDRSIEYKGPNDPSGDPDYTIDLGSETQAVSITRLESGDISSGETVSVDYQHDENFTVSYETNIIVSTVQESIDERKHATADVLAKAGIPVPVDLSVTVVIAVGADRSTTDTALRTNLDNFFSNLRMGDPVRQSDLVRVIENTTGVSYVVVPFGGMYRQEGSTVVREGISTDIASESVLLPSLSSSVASVYILTNELSAATTDGGGPTASFRGVFQDDIALALQDATAPLSALGIGTGRAAIVGSEGASIDGYSDDTTLEAQGYGTAAARSTRRKQLTANHVLVSFEIGDTPTAHAYAATYVVGEDTGAKNIDPSDVAYITQGALTITYDQDQ